MNTPSRSILWIALLIIVALASCSDDETTTGTPPDTTPPAVTSVTPVDAGHIDLLFNEQVRRDTAEQTANYVILEIATPFAAAEAAAPGDTLRVGAASLGSDNRTVTLSLFDLMQALNYEISVTGVTDASGNEITTPVTSTFVGTADPDVTPPEIVTRSPAPSATGVAIGAPVTFQFSEPVDYFSVEDGVSWAPAAGGSQVAYDLQWDGATEFALVPTELLQTNTQYTVTLTDVEDLSSNIMPVTSWSYTTSPTIDTTPPTVVSTVPANGATNVNVNTDLSITLSEAVNQLTFMPQLTPDVGDGIALWSNGGKTVTFDPFAPLLDNQQYTLAMLPGNMADLAGNQSTQVVTVVFSTGSRLESGSFAGTIAGDPGTAAADPTGAFVGAADRLIFEGDDIRILGSDVVADNNTYDIGNLSDDVYYPICVMNTNGDSELDPTTGDAIGLYGINFGTGDLTPDSLMISGGNRITGVNFPLYDSSAITGTVTYGGSYASGNYPIYVGVYDTATFDPTEPPDYGTIATWPFNPEFSFNSFDDGLADGTYYVAAFLDVNINGLYDAATDPAGTYGGTIPTVVDIQNGSDAIGLAVTLLDPVVPFSTAPSVTWPAPAKRAPWLTSLSEAIRRSATFSR